MSDTKERRPLPAGWGWYKRGKLRYLATSKDGVNGDRYIACAGSGAWAVFKSEDPDAGEVAGDLAEDLFDSVVSAEDECWARGLFGTDAVPDAQPDDPPWRWGAVALRDGRDLYGRFREEPWCGGAYRMVADELQRDGSFKRTIFALALFDAEAPMTEDAVRETVMSRHDKACDTLTEPSALPGRCAVCVHDKAAHDALAANNADKKRRRLAVDTIADVLQRFTERSMSR